MVLSACTSAKRKVPSIKVDGVNSNSVLEAVKQPIYSANLIRKKIPESLKNITQVYGSPANCEALLEELTLLNLALGEDLIDKPSSEKDAFTVDLGQMLSKEVESNIPFNSIVKRLSGARKHEKAILSAKVRGKSRRSYLQGWSDAMGCQSTGDGLNLTNEVEQQSDPKSQTVIELEEKN